MQRSDLNPGTVFGVITNKQSRYSFKCLQRGLLGGTQKIMTLKMLESTPPGTEFIEGAGDLIKSSDEGVWYILL